MMRSIDLGEDQITGKIRVSTAAIYREGMIGPYWLVETWIFSDDPYRQLSSQIIHGTPSALDGPEEMLTSRLAGKARRIHGHIASNLRHRFGGWRGIFYRHMWE